MPCRRLGVRWLFTGNDDHRQLTPDFSSDMGEDFESFHAVRRGEVARQDQVEQDQRRGVLLKIFKGVLPCSDDRYWARCIPGGEEVLHKITIILNEQDLLDILSFSPSLLTRSRKLDPRFFLWSLEPSFPLVRSHELSIPRCSRSSVFRVVYASWIACLIKALSPIAGLEAAAPVAVNETKWMQFALAATSPCAMGFGFSWV
jgi:hypothetical protein